MSDADPTPGGEFVLFQSEDGQTRLQVRFDGQTVWLSQRLLAELYQVGVNTINHHIKEVLADGELDSGATIRSYRIVQNEGSRSVARAVEHYNLPMILAVGYRVRSPRGVQFRQWATARLEEYLVKGFVMDDERLKNPTGAGAPYYFDELLARIRDIRSSEKVFWRKVLEIYATSIDYDPRAEASQRFFATVQNKMHWAAHGHTGAEVIASRADAARPHMGLTAWAGGRPRQADTKIAKNYLAAEELDALNRIVSFYLEFAELQATRRRPMSMADWIAKLDDFLRLSDRDILTHAGTVSHEEALAWAEAEYEKFRALEAARPSPVEQHFEESLLRTAQLLEKADPAQGKKP